MRGNASHLLEPGQPRRPRKAAKPHAGAAFRFPARKRGTHISSWPLLPLSSGAGRQTTGWRRWPRARASLGAVGCWPGVKTRTRARRLCLGRARTWSWTWSWQTVCPRNVTRDVPLLCRTSRRPKAPRQPWAALTSAPS